jgi:hypothetical protein
MVVKDFNLYSKVKFLTKIKSFSLVNFLLFFLILFSSTSTLLASTNYSDSISLEEFKYELETYESQIQLCFKELPIKNIQLKNTLSKIQTSKEFISHLRTTIEILKDSIQASSARQNSLNEHNQKIISILPNILSEFYKVMFQEEIYIDDFIEKSKIELQKIEIEYHQVSSLEEDKIAHYKVDPIFKQKFLNLMLHPENFSTQNYKNFFNTKLRNLI